jgi:hypothetical protein
VGQYHEGYPLFADIYNLQEYTNYTVQIQAITILDGVLAPPFTTLTGEDRKYGAINNNNNNNNLMLISRKFTFIYDQMRVLQS